MTVVTDALRTPVLDALRRYISEPSTRTTLRAFVRRRGFSADADDVVQTVLCEALAARVLPNDPLDIPRWVTGILKNKVADAERRRARWRFTELPEWSTPAPRPEVNDLLTRIQADVAETPHRRALGWLFREHAGDSLLEIARQEAIEPTSLRQRICRLRRYLRARYVGPLVVLLALTAGASAVRTQESAFGTSAQLSASYTGTWRVAQASPEKYAGLVVVITESTVEVQGPSGILLREMSIERVSDDRVRLRSGDSVWDASLKADGNTLELRSEQGFVRLERWR
jgi:DNA-directed RNA polymerase specialized sigma24 family protein